MPSFALKNFCIFPRFSIVIAFAFFTDIALAGVHQHQTELVMREGARIEVRTDTGTIAVVAGRRFERRYEWGSCALDAEMQARSARWYGSLGIYDPAARFFFWGLFARFCDGISRTVVQEGQIHFASAKAAEAWIKRYSKNFATVWTNDGLLLQWWSAPGRYQISVNLWQICINGTKPKHLADSADDLFKLSSPNGPEGTRHECVYVNEEVIADTQKVWAEHWRQADELRTRFGKK